MRWLRRAAGAALLAGALGCQVEGEAVDEGQACDPEATPRTVTGPPRLSGPCIGEVASPTRLVVTTTDFATGAVSVVDARTGEVSRDLALASTDAKPFYVEDRVFVIQRYMFDALNILDPGANLRLLGEAGVAVPGVLSANPQAVALGSDGRAYLSLFEVAQLQVLDVRDPGQITVEAPIDLCPLADADGSPEASLLIRCGDTLFVSVQHLDRAQGYSRREARDYLAPVDLTTGRLHDLDAAPGVQAMPLRGAWAKQWRLDRRDPSGHTIYVLSSGLERVDLEALTSEWAVDPSRLAQLGLEDYRLLQAFDIDDEGEHAYLASYTADFMEVLLLKAELDGDGPPVVLADGLQSVEQTLEVVGETLWFGDRSASSAGMRAWDLSVEPPMARFKGAALSTGLAPYAVVAIP